METFPELWESYEKYMELYGFVYANMFFETSYVAEDSEYAYRIEQVASNWFTLTRKTALDVVIQIMPNTSSNERILKFYLQGKGEPSAEIVITQAVEY